MHVWLTFSLTLFPAAIVQFLLWRHAMKTRNAGWVDLGWTLGMAIGSLILIVVLPISGRSLTVLGVVLFWAIRLAAHIYFDRLKDNLPEDGRYTALREHWGENASMNFFFFFEGQAFLSALFLIPATVVARRSDAFPDLWDFVGVLLVFGAVAGESIADRQLAAFRKNPENKGKVCQQGLWYFSRHPNYFFEWLHWMAYPLWSIGSDLHVVTWIGPVLMYIFLRYLTGVPHTERQSIKSRGEAYRRYQQTTSVFFPWIPRNPS